MTARHTLLANAAFSAASALVLLTAADRFYPLFGLTSGALLEAISISVLAYAAVLGIVAMRQPPGRGALMTAAVLDAAWVLGSAIVLLAAWPQLAPGARLMIVGVALIVEIFATLQFRLARSARYASCGPNAVSV